MTSVLHDGADGMGRERAARLAAALFLAAALAAPMAAEAAAPDTPIVSGLSWRSGAKSGACLAKLRRRPLDANHNHLVHKTFAAVVTQTASPWAGEQAKVAPLWVVSVPLLTSDTKGQFDQCANGAFDDAFRQIGANLAAAGAQGLVVRLGHEANLGSDSHAWGVDTKEQIPAYKACWRRAAQAIKAAAPGALLEWTNAKRTVNTAYSVLDLYPGDDVVDLWGVHYYDSQPRKTSQAVWDQYYNATFNGGPWGIGAWLAAAKSHGKRLGIGEWGVWRQPGDTIQEADNPAYIDAMYRFFRDQAPDVAYESLQNSQAEHSLCGETRYPKAAARYKQDWMKGR